MWYPRSQSSQNRSWSSFSDVPQTVQHLHSIHCHGYFLTEMIIFSVNCKQLGWPKDEKSRFIIDISNILLHLIVCYVVCEIFLNNCLPERPHSAHDTNSSGFPVFLLEVASPKQKSQYPSDLAISLPCIVFILLRSTTSWCPPPSSFSICPP